MRLLPMLVLLSAVGRAEDEPEMRKRLADVEAGLPGSLGELEKLLPAWRTKAESDPKLVRLYHEAVSLGRAHKLAADYLTRPVEFAELEGRKRTYLRLDLLRGGRWGYERAQKNEVHIELLDESRRIRLLVDPKGAPLKAIVERLRDAKGGDPAPRALNKHLGKPPGIDVRGHDEKNRFVHIRAWLVPGKKGTFKNLLVEVRERETGTDHELEAILASIREPKSP